MFRPFSQLFPLSKNAKSRLSPPFWPRPSWQLAAFTLWSQSQVVGVIEKKCFFCDVLLFGIISWLMSTKNKKENLTVCSSGFQKTQTFVSRAQLFIFHIGESNEVNLIEA